MKKTAFNTWKSWILAVACCLVYCLLVVVYRLSALFYVEVIEQYNIDRKTASIPFVIMGQVRCFSGFIFGILGERFGLQRITYFGCYLSVFGVGASYFAQNIVTLSVTLGLLYGFGFTATALLPNIIREHFDNTATTISNGLISAGPCLAAIAFPSVITHFIEEYGLSGSFLLAAGITLNSIPLTMILKPRTELSKFHKKATQLVKPEQHISQDKNFENFKDMQIIPLNGEENITNFNIVRENIEHGQTDRCEHKVDINKVSTTYIKEKYPNCSLHNQKGCPCLNISSGENEYFQNVYQQQPIKNVSNPLAKYVDGQPKIKITNIIDCEHTNSQELTKTHQPDNDEDKSNTSKDERNIEKKKGFFYSLNVLKDPTFIAVSFVQGLLAYTFIIWLTTMIDYSRDKDIEQSYEIYILTLNPIADIAGRLGLAWVTDKGYLSVPNFCALLYIFLALSSICIALAGNFAIMTLGILVMTFAMGALLSSFPGMSYAFIEKDKQAVSVASIGLFYAPLSFTVAPLIGYFRGSLGTYDGLYYLLSVMNFACSLIVLLLPKLANRRERRKIKKSQNAAAFEIS